jgi:hypothetical protein
MGRAKPVALPGAAAVGVEFVEGAQQRQVAQQQFRTPADRRRTAPRRASMALAFCSKRCSVTRKRPGGMSIQSIRLGSGRPAGGM